MTVLDLITEALAEIGVYAQGEVISAGDANFGLSKLNRMLDAWNAQKKFAYEIEYQQYILVPNLSPHTIGPAGATYTVAQRPVKIEACNILLNNVAPYVKSPVNIRNDQFWQNNTVPNVTSSIPTDLYYSPSWPNGQLYFWPVPTTAYGVELWFWKVISQFFALTDDVSFPPGYRDCLAYSLAIALAPSFGKSASVELVALTKVARDAVFQNNLDAPKIMTTDSGIPNQNYKNLPSFNWKTGGNNG